MKISQFVPDVKALIVAVNVVDSPEKDTKREAFPETRSPVEKIVFPSYVMISWSGIVYI